LKRLVDQSFYEILEIPRGAPADEVERAYERAFAMYGPGSLVTYTLLAPGEAELLTRRIQEARIVLLDPETRAAYDATLPSDGVEPGRPAGAPADPAAPAPTPAPRPPPAPTALPVASKAGPAHEAAMAGAAAAHDGHDPSRVADPLPAADLLPAADPLRAADPVRATGPAPAPPPQLAAVPAFVQPPPFVPPEGSPWTGEILRQARESRGLSIVQVSERTKITRHHIENIEAERFAELPVAVYLRGILISLARELRLDGQRVARSYLERVATAPKPAKKGR
jgi:curved DNA-binding protein CbpA